uniref:ATP synthase F(0) complex subunit e, mitochondrial n=1 Tax=Plectus sambesii TaxID=2011161 RepID=A0A914UL52_9BILA
MKIASTPLNCSDHVRLKEMAPQPHQIHPNWVVLAPPNTRVSPLIRLSRYVALGFGIMWGAHRYRVIRQKHAVTRDREHREALEQAKTNAELKKLQNKKDMLLLAEQVGLAMTPENLKMLGVDN